MQIAAEFKTNGNMKVVSGTVKDEQGKPLAGANVVVTNDMLGTVVSENGKFAITSTQSSGTLTASYIGYQNERISF